MSANHVRTLTQTLRLAIPARRPMLFSDKELGHPMRMHVPSNQHDAGALFGVLLFAVGVGLMALLRVVL